MMTSILPAGKVLGQSFLYPQGIYLEVHKRFNPAMDKYEMRRQRLQALIDERCEGKKSELAKYVGLSDSYVSRMLSPDGKPGKKRIGEDMVDKIEAAFSLPSGWLDEDSPEVGVSQRAPRFAAVPPPAQQTVDDRPTPEEISELILAYAKASKKNRVAIMNSAKTAADLATQRDARIANGDKT